MALQRRQVELSWFTPNKEDSDCLLHTSDDADSDSLVVIGFIVNVVSEKKSIFTRVPLLGGWFGDGRHWYAITRLQRGSREQSATRTKWNVLDSMYDEPVFLDSDADLLNHLCHIVEDGGNIFRATIRIKDYSE